MVSAAAKGGDPGLDRVLSTSHRVSGRDETWRTELQYVSDDSEVGPRQRKKGGSSPSHLPNAIEEIPQVKGLRTARSAYRSGRTARTAKYLGRRNLLDPPVFARMGIGRNGCCILVQIGMDDFNELGMRRLSSSASGILCSVSNEVFQPDGPMSITTMTTAYAGVFFAVIDGGFADKFAERFSESFLAGGTPLSLHK